MSPRKSSTSSAKPAFRPRYLGVEVVGTSFFPTARWWTDTLTDRLTRSLGFPAPARCIRTDGTRAIVEVGHRHALAARAAWNGPATDRGRPIALSTTRTWGTLVGAKAWLRRAPRQAGATGSRTENSATAGRTSGPVSGEDG